MWIGRWIDRPHSRNAHKDIILYKIFIKMYICVSLSRESTQITVWDSVEMVGGGCFFSFFHRSTEHCQNNNIHIKEYHSVLF